MYFIFLEFYRSPGTIFHMKYCVILYCQLGWWLFPTVSGKSFHPAMYTKTTNQYTKIDQTWSPRRQRNGPLSSISSWRKSAPPKNGSPFLPGWPQKSWDFGTFIQKSCGVIGFDPSVRLKNPLYPEIWKHLKHVWWSRMRFQGTHVIKTWPWLCQRTHWILEQQKSRCN